MANKRVGLFVTCLVDLMRPRIGFAALKLLETAGCEVIVPNTQTCCGQPAWNSGDRAGAEALAKKTIAEFEGFDYIVVPSGSCGDHIRTEYQSMFAEEPGWRDRATAMAARTYELTDFLANVLKVDSVPGDYEGTVTYHDSCSGLRSMGIKAQPRALLAKMKGVELKEMNGCEECCGFGGTFSVKFGEVSAAIAERKCDFIHASGAPAVVGGDLGCLLNIEGKLRRMGDETTQVLHVAEVLAGEGLNMEIKSMRFKANAEASLANVVLQGNLKNAKGKFVTKRAEAIKEIDDFEGTRDAAAAIRNKVIDNLDLWLERFETRAQETGAKVLWAKDGAEVCRLVTEIARQHNVTKVTKSKSMLSEEAGLNQALEAAGIQPVETDLGEYILQVDNNEPPSHIIAPAVHKSLDDVADLFHKVHGTPRKTEIPALTREAREVLRGHFLTAEMGLSGGNFLVAETGSVALVTNEGNGRMVTTLPKVHVVITGIEKVIPTLEDLSTLMRLLPRSATGQSISNYFSILTGVKKPEEHDGPEHLYFILVDAGRADVVGGEFHEMLRCIRCGACMNHCPVYQTIGGHAYGWVYPGPMGSVLTPLYAGIENAIDLPHAATLCNQCGVVCPVKIPLPELLRKLREKQTDAGLRPLVERIGLRLWAWVAQRPALYGLGARLGARYLKWLAGEAKSIRLLPAAQEWTNGRDFPAPQGKTFRELYAARQKSAKEAA